MSSHAEYLEIGDRMAVQGSRNQARSVIAIQNGIPYVRIKVQRVWMKPCSCDACLAGHANEFHGYDEYWVYCSEKDEEAVGWWIG